MALNASTLSLGIQAKLASKNAALASAGIDLVYLADSIAEAVVEHVTANAVVTVTTASACTANGATGTGTGTVA
jgi:hypothetical protein